MKQILKLITAGLIGFLACFSWTMGNQLCRAEVVRPQIEKGE